MPKMVFTFAAATACAATPSIARKAAEPRPRLTVDAAALQNEIVVVGERASPTASQVIWKTISSPPVSLYRVTDGLVGGTTSEQSRPETIVVKALDQSVRELQSRR